MKRVVIALGSNIAPEFNLPRAVDAIGDVTRVVKCSTVWQSAPVGFSEQPDFCNAAVLIETELTPHSLKAELLRIEAELGRVRDPRNKNGPRTIDLDLALYADDVIDDPVITVPDPEILHRPFLAVPVAELVPLMPHPVTGKLMAVIARSCGGTKSLTARNDIRLLHAGSAIPDKS
jgi:2-amino-4-hydroxy-6-hydroxymethyldihydropteridine diphosphokinase